MTFVRKSNQSSQLQEGLLVSLPGSTVALNLEELKLLATSGPMPSLESSKPTPTKSDVSSNLRGKRYKIQNDEFMLPLLKFLIRGGKFRHYAHLKGISESHLTRNFSNWMKRKYKAVSLAQMVAIAFRKGLVK